MNKRQAESLAKKISADPRFTSALAVLASLGGTHPAGRYAVLVRTTDGSQMEFHGEVAYNTFRN